jgi:CRISPR-associated protein Csx10
MNCVWLKLTLLDDVVVSERSATVGGHRTLDYLPGSVLLGAVAARSYRELDEEAAFRIFHSGRVRFGAACPVDDADRGGVTIPTPLSLHVEKNGSDTALINRALPPNATADTRADKPQLKLAPTGFRDASLSIVGVSRRTTMRTAVGLDGRARDGHLYTLSAIERGAQFLARVDADLADDLRCVRALDGQVIRVGKARSAEFGGVKVEVLSEEPPQKAYAEEEGDARDLRILALSDLVLRSEEGMPTFTPTPKHFGLPADWSWAPEQSFARVRTWSPFNSTRARPDLERQALVAGTVLAFRGSSPVSLASVRAHVARGVGDARAEGLGRVLVQPVILSGRNLRVETRDAHHPPAQEAPKSQPVAASELSSWLEAQFAERTQREAAWEAAMRIAGEFANSNARLPRAQWGELRSQAKQWAPMRPDVFVGNLREFLLEAQVAPARGEQRTGNARKGEKRWGQKVRIGGERQALGKWLVERINEELSRGAAAVAPGALLELVAIHAPRMQAARALPEETNR